MYCSLFYDINLFLQFWNCSFLAHYVDCSMKVAGRLEQVTVSVPSTDQPKLDVKIATDSSTANSSMITSSSNLPPLKRLKKNSMSSLCLCLKFYRLQSILTMKKFR
jgi:hypothetical protein